MNPRRKRIVPAAPSAAMLAVSKVISMARAPARWSAWMPGSQDIKQVTDSCATGPRMMRITHSDPADMRPHA
jgi:hypothetical protein